MAVEILVAAVGKPGVTERGYPWIIKETPCVWGKKEGLPNWVILRITDATKEQIEHFLTTWKKSFVYEILNENEQGYRIKITVDPVLVSVSGLNKEMKSELKTFIKDNFSGNIVNFSSEHATLDIPKPVDLVDLKAQVLDLFEVRVDTRIYHFSNTDVDWALSQPDGIAEMTKSEVLSRIINKLDE